ncbi:MAG: hypothetical protein Q8O87_01240 [bacterium]|nr:hypothetical protein [bacterium]
MYNGEYERMWLLVKLGKLYILAHPKLHGDKVMKFADTEAGVRHFSADGIELEQ